MYNASFFLMPYQASKRLRTIGAPDIARSRKDPSLGRVLFRCWWHSNNYIKFFYLFLLGLLLTPFRILPRIYAQGSANITKDCFMIKLFLRFHI